MKRKAAVTLLEAMVSLALFSMVTLLMANLMKAAANSEKYLGEKDRIHEVSVSCLYRMAHELRTANLWHQPALGASAAELDFECPDWQLEDQEFPSSPTPFPPTWAPPEPGYQARVRYALNGAQLERSLRAEAQTWTTPLLRDCLALSAARPSATEVRLSLTVLSRGQPREFAVSVSPPAEVWKPR